MNCQHCFERQTVGVHENRHQGRGPIMNMQNLHRWSESPRQFDHGFAKKDKTRCIIFVILAVLPIDFRAIKEFVAANEKELYPLSAAALEIFGMVGFAADRDVDSYA